MKNQSNLSWTHHLSNHINLYSHIIQLINQSINQFFCMYPSSRVTLPSDLPKAEDAPESLLDNAQEHADLAPTSPSPMDEVPDSLSEHASSSPVEDEVPVSPIETNDVEVHVGHENTASEEDAADALDRHLSEPVDDEGDSNIDQQENAEEENISEADDKKSVSEAESANDHDAVQTQLSFESSNPDEAESADLQSPMEDNNSDQVESNENNVEDNTPAIPEQPASDPEQEIPEPTVATDVEPVVEPSAESKAAPGPDSKFGCCMDSIKCLITGFRVEAFVLTVAKLV